MIRARLAHAPFAAAGLLLLVAGLARAEDTGRRAITAQDLQHTVDVLASDDFEGRAGGSPGNRKAGEWLVSELKKIPALEPAGDEGGYFQNFKSGDKQLRNIVVTLPAREGSEHADECVVVGSHYDHVGRGEFGALDFLGGKGKIHHGADDNASGSAGNLALARAFAAAGPAHRRIVFIWFDGEEMGLFGSIHYCKHPVFPLAKTAGMLNMDMIGRARDEKLIVYGLNTGSFFDKLFNDTAKDFDLKLDSHETLPPDSDYYSFYQKKVPVVALFTGLHKDYHRATDTSDKIVAGTMEKIAQLAYSFTRNLADKAERAAFGKAKPGGEAEAAFDQIKSMISDQDLTKIFGGEDGIDRIFKQGGLQKVREMLRGADNKPRLGVQIDTNDEGDGVLVSVVTKGSIAERAGIKADDRILSLAGRETGDFDLLKAAVRAAEGKTKAVIERGGERLEVTIDFGAGDKADAKKSGEKRWF